MLLVLGYVQQTMLLGCLNNYFSAHIMLIFGHTVKTRSLQLSGQLNTNWNVHCGPMSSQRHLRSSEWNLLHVPRHRLDTYGATYIDTLTLNNWEKNKDLCVNHKVSLVSQVFQCRCNIYLLNTCLIATANNHSLTTALTIKNSVNS